MRVFEDLPEFPSKELMLESYKKGIALAGRLDGSDAALIGLFEVVKELQEEVATLKADSEKNKVEYGLIEAYDEGYRKGFNASAEMIRALS